MRFVAAAAISLGLVAGPLGDLGDSVAVHVDRVVEPVDTPPTTTREPVVESVIPDVVRHVVEELPGRKPSIQDHDDVEDTDRPDPDIDVPEEDDGRVINGEFEGGSTEQGHNVTSTRP